MSDKGLIRVVLFGVGPLDGYPVYWPSVPRVGDTIRLKHADTGVVVSAVIWTLSGVEVITQPESEETQVTFHLKNSETFWKLNVRRVPRSGEYVEIRGTNPFEGRVVSVFHDLYEDSDFSPYVSVVVERDND